MYADICRILNCLKPVNVNEQKNNLASEKQFLFVLPSFSMFQLYMDIVYQNSALTLVPILGKCSTSLIENYILQKKRVVNIGLVEARTDRFADDQYAGHYIFSLHDIYHGIRYSMIPKNQQKALIHINKIFADALKKDSSNQDLKHLKWKLIDGELNKIGEPFHTFFSLPNVGWKPQFKEMVIKNMVKEKEKWAKEYKLNKSDLALPEQELYEKFEKKYLFA